MGISDSAEVQNAEDQFQKLYEKVCVGLDCEGKDLLLRKLNMVSAGKMFPLKDACLERTVNVTVKISKSSR
jgi:hypothetical protein